MKMGIGPISTTTQHLVLQREKRFFCIDRPKIIDGFYKRFTSNCFV